MTTTQAVSPCCAPGCPDTLGGFVRPGNLRPSRVSLARFRMDGSACDRCYSRIAREQAAQVTPADPAASAASLRAAAAKMVEQAEAAKLETAVRLRKAEEAADNARRDRPKQVSAAEVSRLAVREYRTAWANVKGATA